MDLRMVHEPATARMVAVERMTADQTDYVAFI